MTATDAPARVRAVAAVAVAAVAVLGVAAAHGARADAASGEAAAVVEQVRATSRGVDFSATAEVVWRNASGERRSATVELRASDGALALTSGDQLVLGEQGDTFVRDDLGWWAPARDPRPSRRPPPDARWGLEARRGTALGRPATTVVARRGDGSPALRLTVDDATRLVVAREVVSRDRTVERGFRFTAFALGPPATSTATSTVASPSAPARDADAMRDVPDEFEAPATLAGGYRLVSRSRAGDGVRLVYSDGLFTLSVVEQAGELDWRALPERGAPTTVDGVRAHRYVHPLGDVIVWERDGVVFTCVSDAPSDSSVVAMAAITSSPGLVDRVVDFVLGPFAFD